MFAGHDEQLPDHPGTFTDVLLHELRSGDTDEPAVRVVCYRTGEERLSRPRRSVEQYSLGLSDSERFEELRVFDWQLDDLLDLLDLFVKTTDHLVCRIRDFFDHHESYERVHLVGEVE